MSFSRNVDGLDHHAISGPSKVDVHSLVLRRQSATFIRGRHGAAGSNSGAGGVDLRFAQRPELQFDGARDLEEILECGELASPESRPNTLEFLGIFVFKSSTVSIQGFIYCFARGVQLRRLTLFLRAARACVQGRNRGRARRYDRGRSRGILNWRGLGCRRGWRSRYGCRRRSHDLRSWRDDLRG
jgi:hypothetical protein